VTNQSKDTQVSRLSLRARPGRSGMAALRILDMCPLLPVDAFRHIAGFRSIGGAYRRLEKLRRAGLAEMERAELGYLLADGPLGLWSITEHGQRLFGEVSCAHRRALDPRGPRKPPRGEPSLTTRVAAYRLLAFLVAEGNADGRKVELCAWEHPWVRTVCSPEQRNPLRVQLPAGAVLAGGEMGGECARPAGRIRVVLVPDLGAAPITRYREMLRRLNAYREFFGDADFQLLVATIDPDGNGGRYSVWVSLLDRLARTHGTPAFSSRVVGWGTVQHVLSGSDRGDRAVDWRTRDHRGGVLGPLQQRRGPGRTRDQLLHLVGRHPLLTAAQLADLLGTSVPRIRRLESDLVRTGWLKRVEMEELPTVAVGWSQSEFRDLGLVEITLAGQRSIAASLGLDAKTATRYHGLIGAGRPQAGKRRRMLLALAHTLGANAVFVAFATAAWAVRRAGGSDDLVEWRGAAACERKYCKPDGYGCYVRNGVAHGFFLEYDRGTESTRTYLAKFRAYYRYRDSRQADRDYSGFPTLLFVTTRPHAEERIADAAHRAWFLRGTEPLAVLITTTSRITSDRQAVLGRIWRRPGRIGATANDERRYWLRDGAPGKLVGGGRTASPPGGLAWFTTGTPRKTRRCSLANAAGAPESRGGPPPFKNPADSLGVSRSELRQPEGSQHLGSFEITSLRVRPRPEDMQ
jgi:hypothetical protein